MKFLLLICLFLGSFTVNAEILKTSGVETTAPLGYQVYCKKNFTYDCGLEYNDSNVELSIWEINSLNTRINNSVKYIRDQDKYKLPDYWEEAKDEGDCEDFAIRKFNELVKLGVSPKNLRYAFVYWSKDKELKGHIVLLYDTKDNTFVLDNNYDFVYHWTHNLTYKYYKIQVPSSRIWEKY